MAHAVVVGWGEVDGELKGSGMSLLGRVMAGVAGMLLLAGCVAAPVPDPTPSAPGVVVSDAWVRSTTGATDTSMTAAFLTLTNSSAAQATLVRAGANVGSMVQLHEMVMSGDSMVMQEAAGGIPVPGNGTASLAPGGYHVMIMGLTAPLEVGAEVHLTLTFADETTLQVSAPVKEYAEEEDHYHATTSPSAEPTGAATKAVQIQLAAGKVQPSGERLEAARGDVVEFVITSDRDDSVHIHGVDVEIPVKAGTTVTRKVALTQSGRFEVESHDPELLILQLIVR